MKTFVIAGLVVLAALIGGFFWLNNYIYEEKQAPTATDYREAEYIVEGKRVKLMGGMAEEEAAPGSAAKVVTRIFGNEAKGDLNGDGIPDIAFILTQEGGGSGTFFYVAAAVQNADNSYQGTNAIFLGDRVSPQSTEIRDGELIVNYGTREAGDAMTDDVTVGVSRYLKLENMTLVEEESGITWLLEDSGAVAESGAPLTNVGVNVNGSQRNVGVYEGSCFVVEDSEWPLLEGEVSGVICYFAGGGTELGMFEENGALVLKEGVVEEGSGDTEGMRGDFETKFSF
jgi:hypothetical protein